MNRCYVLFGLLSASCLALGCEPDLERVNITQATTPPLAVVVTGTRIEVPEGIAVAVDVVGINDEGDEEPDIDVPLIYSAALGVISTAVQGRFIFYGSEIGSGTVPFTALGTNGQVDVPFTVTAQP